MNAIAVAAFIALAVGVYFMWRVVRSPQSGASVAAPLPKKDTINLIVYDGSVVRSVIAKPCPEGVQVGDSIYESAMLLPIISNRGLAGYLFGADRVALSQHDAFESSRVRILRNRFTKSGGDFADMLKYVSSAAIIIVSFFLWMQLRGISGGMNELAVRIGAVETTLSRPLNTIPLPQAPQQPATPQQP